MDATALMLLIESIKESDVAGMVDKIGSYQRQLKESFHREVVRILESDGKIGLAVISCRTADEQRSDGDQCVRAGFVLYHEKAFETLQPFTGVQCRFACSD